MDTNRRTCLYYFGRFVIRKIIRDSWYANPAEPYNPTLDFNREQSIHFPEECDIDALICEVTGNYALLKLDKEIHTEWNKHRRDKGLSLVSDMAVLVFRKRHFNIETMPIRHCCIKQWIPVDDNIASRWGGQTSCDIYDGHAHTLCPHSYKLEVLWRYVFVLLVI